MWEPKKGEKRSSIKSLIESHQPAIINVAEMAGGDPVDGQPVEAMRSIIMHLLSSEVLSSTCQGWFNEGRSTTIYCDELSSVAPPTEEATRLVSDLRDKAREAGVRLVFATQRFDQVDPRLRSVLDGFGCVVYMQETGVKTAREIAALLDPDDPEAWNPTDITSLAVRADEGYAESIVKMRSSATSEPPFTLRWPWWEDIDPEDLKPATKERVAL